MQSTPEEMLSIKEFIRTTEFKLSDVLPFDLIWNSVQRDAPIYITDEILAIFGYSGSKKYHKRNLNDLTKGRNISVIRLKNTEYQAFLDEPATISNAEKYGPYPLVDNSCGKSGVIHTLIASRDLDLLMMSCTTANGLRLKEYFIDMQRLLVKYLNYQCDFYKRSIKTEMKEIYDMPHNRKYNTLRKLQELDDRLAEKYRVGVIYFICETDTRNIAKIGYTYNLRKRLQELQLAHYKELIVENYCFTQFPRDEEARLHEKYKDTHIRGEWYRLPQEKHF